MPYHAYVSWLVEMVLKKTPRPLILEIGVDAGQTMIPIVQRLVDSKHPFHYIGVDIRKDEKVANTLLGHKVAEDQTIEYKIANSLEWLPNCTHQFDVILHDGDHNYYTVEKELKYINKLLKKDGILICDDYSGKWAARDMFYHDRPTHKDNELTTKPIELEKKGVKSAIDDFIKDNPEWKLDTPIKCEAVMLKRKA